KTIRRLSRFAFTGIVSVCPYYNRPTQAGMLAHFTALAEATDRQILIYNVPYRTSVNLTNETLLRLAELPNIVGVKDSSGNIAQSLDLLRHRPEGFAVMTGDDASFLHDARPRRRRRDPGLRARRHRGIRRRPRAHAGERSS